MNAIPGAARAYICCAVLGALACVLPVSALPGPLDPDGPWPAVLLLGTLYALCEAPNCCSSPGCRSSTAVSAWT
ncbi:hypothetical protein AB0R12_21905, partial [Streptomyces niveus]